MMPSFVAAGRKLREKWGFSDERSEERLCSRFPKGLIDPENLKSEICFQGLRGANQERTPGPVAAEIWMLLKWLSDEY